MIIRISNWAALQHYKTRSAPWVKSYRKDLLPETDEGKSFLAVSMAARGLLSCLERLAVETGNATLLDLGWLGWRLQTTDSLAPLIDELLANGRLELAESAISVAIPGASIAAIVAASRVSTSRSSRSSVNPALSRSSGTTGDGERAVREEFENDNGARRSSSPESIASVLRRAAAGGE